uniref:Putative structural protein n=1 Tax=viral metagenome TaxID=1070528 RepID=A0A6M3KZK1_9ZZZZ
MANTDRPHGFSPVGAILRVRPYHIEAATILYIGDAVELQADGYIETCTAGDLAIIGVSRGYSSSTASDDILVYDDTEQTFEAQDNASATLAITSLGSNFDHVAGSGSTVTFISAHEIDASTASNATGTWVLLDLVNRPDNAWGTWGDYVVQRNMGEGILQLAAGL